MAIQKSKLWNDGSDKEEPKVYEELAVSDCEAEDTLLEDYEYKKPVFNKNFYLDDGIYDKYVSSKEDSGELLKYISSTSPKEDKVFVKVGLIFMGLLFLVCGLEILVNKLQNKDLTSWGALRYVITSILTFLVVKFVNKKKER